MSIDVHHFKAQLLEERERVQAAIAHLREDHPGSLDDEVEEVAATSDSHLGEAASATLNREIDYTLGENSSYQAGTVTVRRRFSRGLFFRANYTFGKSLDTQSGLNYAGDGGYQGAQDSRNLKSERGRSDFDVRHVFSMIFAWQMPFRQNVLLRGWQLAGSGVIYSGQPLTPQLSGPSNDLAQATRPDRIANGALDDPP